MSINYKHLNITLMKTRNIILVLLFSLLAGTTLATASSRRDTRVRKHNQPALVIFDCDMGNDIDDAMALDMLYKYIDAGQVKLLGIMTSKAGTAAAKFIDIMNTWYGHPNIPIGIVHDGPTYENESNDYPLIISNMKKSDGTPFFARTVANADALPKAETLYRKILARQRNNSVIIISTGFSTNIAHLLETKADRISQYDGRTLVAKKVKFISIMAGSLNKNPEFNVQQDVKSFSQLVDKCPVQVISSPFEVGIKLIYQYEDGIKKPLSWTENHPLKMGYDIYHSKGETTPTWDLTAVLYAVEGDSCYFKRSCRGNITADEKGATYFSRSRTGKRYFLEVPSDEQCKRIIDRFKELIGRRPRIYMAR